jgi:hypothetical protein
MKKKDIKLALTKMGYRELEKNVWAKPIANHLFTYDLEKSEWLNIFKGLTDKILVWNSHNFGVLENEADFLRKLKMCESTNISSGNEETNFEFLTVDDQLAEFLG